MTTMISLRCKWCNSSVLKLKKEVDRRLRSGRSNFYCDSVCASHCINSREHVKDANRERAFATFGPLIHNPYHAAKAKYGREKWKYRDLFEALLQTDLTFRFEHPLLTDEGFVRLYDLAIFERQLLIEFDGKYHNRSVYFHRDDEKDALAEKCGWNLVRIPVLENSVISVEYLSGLI